MSLKELIDLVTFGAMKPVSYRKSRGIIFIIKSIQVHFWQGKFNLNSETLTVKV